MRHENIISDTDFQLFTNMRESGQLATYNPNHFVVIQNGIFYGVISSRDLVDAFPLVEGIDTLVQPITDEGISVPAPFHVDE